MTTTPRRRIYYVAALASIALLASCIVSDQLTTVTINADGSAELICVQTNVHSSEQGAKAAADLERYRTEFNQQQSADDARLLAAGALLQEARWLREEPPLATVATWRLPSADVLQRAFTIPGDDGQALVTAQFTSEGERRRFSLVVSLPPEQTANVQTQQTLRELRQTQADNLSETRFVVASGKIEDARGFTVAGDRQSALLEVREIIEALRGQRQYEAYLVWNVAPTP